MFKEQKVEYQPLLIPHITPVGATLMTDMENLKKYFKNVQLEIEPFGSDSILCREIPVWMQNIDLTIYMNDLIDYYRSNQKPDLLTLHDHALESLACHASVKFNTHLDMDAMKEVIIHLQQMIRIKSL